MSLLPVSVILTVLLISPGEAEEESDTHLSHILHIGNEKTELFTITLTNTFEMRMIIKHTSTIQNIVNDTKSNDKNSKHVLLNINKNLLK